jgi:hypothetical protein
MTWYPAEASQQSDFGRNTARSEPIRPGDWAETLSGNLGQNINDSLTDAATFFGTDTEFSPPPGQGGLGWGKALKTTIYVWGNPQTAGMSCTGGSTYCDDESLQETDTYTRPLPPPGSGTESVVGWKDVLVRGSSGTYQAVSPGQYRDMRVRFTHAYTVIFYENLQGSCTGCVNLPACSTDLVTGNGSEAVGFILNEQVSDPPPGEVCTGGWQVGGGVYTRQIEP